MGSYYVIAWNIFDTCFIHIYSTEFVNIPTCYELKVKILIGLLKVIYFEFNLKGLFSPNIEISEFYL